MASANIVILMGNLTRDPQTKFTANQTQVAEFGLACNRKFKGQDGQDRDEVLFVDCTAFGKTAELIGQHFTKGKPILIQGRLRFESWDDKNGGGKRSKISVVCDTFQFIGAKSDGDGGGREEQPFGGRESAPASPQRPAQRQQQEARPAPNRPPQRQQPASDFDPNDGTEELENRFR